VIDLSRVSEAEAASERKDYARVRQLLGAWPAPLAIFLRTPDGQMLAAEARSLIAKALGLLGTACVKLGDGDLGEEVFRLAVQYAQDGVVAGEIFRRLGEALLEQSRPGEAVAALRRAINLGGQGQVVWPLLARAFIARRRYVAALTCVREALAVGAPESAVADEQRALEAALGPSLAAFKAHLQPTRSA
jgi:tetratricopeptide (TPR) repeat protein